MLSEEEKRELFKKLNDAQKEVTTLRVELNQTDEQKEAAFNSKEEHSKKIRELIRKIKDNKSKRDSLTEQVKKDKELRDQLNSKIANKISEFKNLSREKQGIIKKHKINADPFQIKNEIERLESRIETEVMSFEREKEIMKRIKELKKEYKDSKDISSIFGKIDSASKEIDGLKAEAEDAHKRIQSRAKESQSRHEEMIASSKEADELRVKEESAFHKFVEMKKKFDGVNEKLKEKLLEMNKAKKETDKYQLENKVEKQRVEEEFLKMKEEDVQKKMKRGEKLTTEDILVFQRFNK